MKIDILTLFPEMFVPLKESIIGKARDKHCLEINLINIRDFSLDKHHKCDDYIFGGGEGLLMTPQPLFDAIESVKKDNSYIIYMSPKGKTLTQKIVKDFSTFEHLIIICGHYEGVDQRVIDVFVDAEISIGDYVVTGGELPAMVFVDAISRFIPGVLGNIDSAKHDSFENNLLEYPQYTRPQDFRGLKVPDVLISGNHAEIAKWREEQSRELTKQRRPDMCKD